MDVKKKLNKGEGETLAFSDHTTKKRRKNEAFLNEEQNASVSGDASILRNILLEDKTADIVFVDSDDESDGDTDEGELVSFCTSNGKPKVLFSPKVLGELRQQWKSSLLVTLFGKTIEYNSLCLKARAIWKLKGEFSVVDLGENFFLFTFQSKEDCMYVCTEGPWVVIDHFLSVRKWEPNFKPSESRFIMKSAVWVRFHELPVEFYRDKILRSIAKSLGRPIKVDHSVLRKYARMCIEIDLSTPLCPVIDIEGKDYEVEYESLDSFCFKCSHSGHLKNIDCHAVPNINNVASEANIFKNFSKRMEEDDSDKAKPKDIDIKPKETKKGNANSSDKKKQNPCQSTFSTMCPHCLIKYKFYRDLINTVLWCRCCTKYFTASERNDLEPNNNGEMGSHRNAISDEPRARESVVKTEASELGGDSNEKSKFFTKINGRRERQINEENSDTRKEHEEEDVIEENIIEGGSRAMKDDDMNKMKPTETEKEKGDVSPMENGREINVEANSGSETYEYPDPEFNDFDKKEREDCFKVGQIWAVYDELDGMPRLYAQISKIISRSASDLKITWLDSYSEGEDEMKIVDAEFACGRFRKGSTETIHKSALSHKLQLEKGLKRATYMIYPRKGETWALFKKWDLNWHSDPKSKRKYELEFVEVLSGYEDDKGVSVAYLNKIKGFSSLFYRTGADLFNIPNNQLFRFSHRVPCVRLSGEERDDVPKGSFELDPASLPSKIEEFDVPKDRKAEMELDNEGNNKSTSERSDSYEIPGPEFFSFDAEKSPEKFQPGQLWALYCHKDRLPKCYAFIKEVYHQPEFKLHITRLAACQTNNILNYADNLMPIGCGMFKHYEAIHFSYTDTSSFSHRLNVVPTDQMNEFVIYPRKGEVWAVYKYWKSGMASLYLLDCGYDIVEILEENSISVKAVELEMVCGHNSVFKARKGNTSYVTVEIDKTNLLKFSHQIPAFRLTDEKSGVLKGYWQLDSAALPIEMFSSG